LRAGDKVFLKLLYSARQSFGNYFDASVRTISHLTQHLMSRRGALREEAITNSLHLAPYQKLPRHFRHRYS
jgi:hypothetical protein